MLKEIKKEKERVEKLNQADNLIFQTEKSLKEYGDKIPAQDKSKIEDVLNKLREAHKNQDLTSIDKYTAELNEVFGQASQKMYNQSSQSQQQAPYTNTTDNKSNTNNSDNISDVDYEEIK